MSFAGLKKQINKANQFMSEKIGGAEATKLDDDFIEMEKKIDVFDGMVEELITKTTEYLQPNPASRARLAAVQTYSKIRGQATSSKYLQTEGELGDSMVKTGAELGSNSLFGTALCEVGESMKECGEIKDALDMGVKQNFLDPLQHLQNKDLKEINFHRKKLQGRRLDFDCKRRKKEKGGAVTNEDLRVAEEKFEESKELALSGMHNLLDSEEEQITQLFVLVDSMVDFHRGSLGVLENLQRNLRQKMEEAATKPKVNLYPKPSISSRSSAFFDADESPMPPPSYESSTKGPSASASTQKQPCCKALYDFDAENEGELEFKEGDFIILSCRLDENWFEGSVNGRSGYFPVSYVEVVNDL